MRRLPAGAAWTVAGGATYPTALVAGRAALEWACARANVSAAYKAQDFQTFQTAVYVRGTWNAAEQFSGYLLTIDLNAVPFPVPVLWKILNDAVVSEVLPALTDVGPNDILELRAVGTLITVWSNGVQVAGEMTDADFASGKTGVMAWGTGADYAINYFKHAHL